MDNEALESPNALLDTARQAVFHARSRFLSGHTVLNRWDIEDMIQAAALVYWQSLRRGEQAGYTFAAASRAAACCYAQAIVGRNPLDTVELTSAAGINCTSGSSDAPNDAGERSWLEEVDLVAALTAARQSAARARVDAIETDVRIIRLLAQGYTNAGIATVLGTTEKSIRNRRHRIKQQLKAACAKMGIQPPEYPAEAQGGYKYQAAWKRVITR
ncbi:MAG TPA: LuxR C-terminal-related transcriptional regulator [Anaerolineae bacterium]|nr:LuxR C-terminal-related transcriptional regulator [Anaerolineae bacterium]